MIIILEGPDGVGKDTVASGITQLLINDGFRVHILPEPPTQSLGSYFRERALLVNEHVEISSLNEALLLMAARRENYELFITEALKTNDIVIVTRNWMSVESYQMNKVPLHLKEQLDILNRTLVDDLIEDVKLVEILLYCEFDIAKERMLNRNTLDKIESRGDEYLLEVNARYASLIGTDGVYVVDAAKSKEDVLNDTWVILKEELYK